MTHGLCDKVEESINWQVRLCKSCLEGFENIETRRLVVDYDYQGPPLAGAASFLRKLCAAPRGIYSASIWLPWVMEGGKVGEEVFSGDQTKRRKLLDGEIGKFPFVRTHFFSISNIVGTNQV